MTIRSTPSGPDLDTAFHWQANLTALFLVKCRARAMARCPMALEILVPGLSRAKPETLIATAKHLTQKEPCLSG